MWAGLAHFFGLDNLSGPFYGFWSGIGADAFRFLGWIGLWLIVWHRGRCHVHGCWRSGRFPVAGTPYTVCQKHHPDVPERIGEEHVGG